MKRHHQLYKAFLLLFCMLLLGACAPLMQQGPVGPEGLPEPAILDLHAMSPQELLDYASPVYLNAYNSYVVDVKKPDRTDKENQFLVKKKKALIDMKRTMIAIKTFLVNDQPPTPDLVNDLIALIDEMTTGGF